jgi:hypothetical protein
VTIGLAVLATGFFVAGLDTPIRGLTERITILVGFQWTFTFAVRLLAWQNATNAAARAASGEG